MARCKEDMELILSAISRRIASMARDNYEAHRLSIKSVEQKKSPTVG